MISKINMVSVSTECGNIIFCLVPAPFAQDPTNSGKSFSHRKGFPTDITHHANPDLLEKYEKSEI